MTKQNISNGDIILIPVGGGLFGLGRVLFISKRYKNVILLGVFDQFTKSASLPLDLEEEMPLMLYTSQQPIKDARWIYIGNEPLKNGEYELSKRIIAGNTWINDDKIGPATPEDAKNIPEMLVLGAGLVEKKAFQLIQKHLIS